VDLNHICSSICLANSTNCLIGLLSITLNQTVGRSGRSRTCNARSGCFTDSCPR
jgi:hypothetical protein